MRERWSFAGRPVRHNGVVEEAPSLHTLKRRQDEPRLALGDTVDLKDGTKGIVVARYTPSGRPDEIRYVVRIEPAGHQKQRP